LWLFIAVSFFLENVRALSSFISSFRILFVAGLAILLLELAVKLIASPTLAERSDVLLHEAVQGETFDRLLLWEKIKLAEESRATIVTVGDSSGLHSLNPDIVNRLIGDERYENFSTGANYGYEAWADLIGFLKSRISTLKTVVLYINPWQLPSEGQRQISVLAPVVRQNLAHPWVLLKSSLNAFRYEASRLAFWWMLPRKQDASYSKTYQEMLAAQPESLGFFPEQDFRVPDVNFGKQYSFKYHDPWYPAGNRAGFIYDDLRLVASAAARAGVELALVFNPVPSAVDPGECEDPARAELDRFIADHPEVQVPLQNQQIWPHRKFARFNHIAQEYVWESSVRLALILRRLVGLPPLPGKLPDIFSFEAAKHELEDPANRQIGEWLDENISPEADVKRAVFAFHRYMLTGDPAERASIARPTLEHIDRIPFLRETLDSRWAKVNGLREQGIEVTYDYNTLALTMVRPVDGAESRDDICYVQCSGFLHASFGRRDPQSGGFTVADMYPVFWSAERSLVIPLRREDGRWKADPEQTADHSLHADPSNEATQ